MYINAILLEMMAVIIVFMSAFVPLSVHVHVHFHGQVDVSVNVLLCIQLKQFGMLAFC